VQVTQPCAALTLLPVVGVVGSYTGLDVLVPFGDFVQAVNSIVINNSFFIGFVIWSLSIKKLA